MKVAAFSCGKNYTSARFRVRQFIPDLAEFGIDVREYIAPIYKHYVPPSHNRLWLSAIRVARPIALVPSVIASHRHDASWIQKEMIWGRDTLERFTKGPRILDVDDAIWAERDGSAEHMARLAGHVDVVVGGNQAIAEWFEPHARDVRIVATAVDTNLFKPAEPGTVPEHPFTIVWTGQQVTLEHLAVAEPALAEFMNRHDDVRFQAISDVPPQMRSVPADRTKWIPWSPEVEVSGIQEADVGIMPLVDNENGRAKCAFKMLQYMGCAVPSIVTPIGFNRDLLATGEVGLGPRTVSEWVDAFEYLYADRDTTAKMGAEGRRIAIEQFDRPIIAKQLADLFHEVAAR
jgi:glycosyltransferase involved in cell wall biosynthesis